MVIVLIVGVLVFVEVLLLFKLKLDVAGFARYWQKQNNAARGEILYIALGDSTAQAIGATSPMRGYVGLISEGLEKKTGKSVRLINLSVSGARIPDVTNNQLPRLNNYEVSDEVVVTLSIGANDLRQHDRRAFTNNMDTLLSLLPPQTAVADIAYFGGGRYRHLEPEVLEMNKVINSLILKYHLKPVPLHQVTQARERFGVHSVDWLHPSNKGYKNWYEAFKQPLGL